MPTRASREGGHGKLPGGTKLEAKSPRFLALLLETLPPTQILTHGN